MYLGDPELTEIHVIRLDGPPAARPTNPADTPNLLTQPPLTFAGGATWLDAAAGRGYR